MAHTYVCNLVHVVFSTKQRRPKILSEMRPRLWSYFGGIAKKNGFKLLAAGGLDDHAHLLLSLPPILPISKAVQLIKGGSSKWLNEQGLDFAWQEAYAAFTVSASQVQKTTVYINAQEQHHRKRNFAEELRALLRAHGVEFDEKYLLG